MLFRTLIYSCAAAAMSLHAQEPFDVSLAYSSADLSPYYRAVIREATERYRGDGLSGMVTEHIQIYGSFGSGSAVEIEVTNDPGGTDIYLFKRMPTGARLLLSQGHFESDPFPIELLTLSNTTQTVHAHLTNQ